MKREGMRAQVGYGSKPFFRGGGGRGRNVLDRAFAREVPNTVTDITPIRTYEGWLFGLKIVQRFCGASRWDL